jgi:hypothetical protein
MKFSHGTALLCLISASLPLAVACGSNASSGLFSNGGTFSIPSGGSPGSSGGTGNAGQASGGTASTSGGGSSVAGQGSSGTSTGGNRGVAGSDVGGMSAGGGAGTSNGGASGGSAGTASVGGGAGSGGTSASGGSGGGSGGSGGGSGGSGGGSGGSGGAGGGSGGASGSVGVGGSSGGPGMGCPPEKPPQDGAVCAVQTPDNCFYPGEACSCLSDGNTATRHWGCYGTPNKCPDLADGLPVDGASCKTFGAGALCPYSSTNYCVCTPSIGGGGGDPKWVCNDPTPQCPGMRPDNNTSCLLGGSAQGSAVRECAYGERECFCNGTLWTCE